MMLVTLPFSATPFEQISSRFEFARFPAEDSPPPAETELWVPPYGFDLDYAGVLSKMPKLQVIQTQSAGVDHIIDFVDPSITLCNARGVHDAATAELGVGLILASLRRIPQFVQAQGRGEWTTESGIRSLADRRVLIVGYGSIGKALERRLAGFEVEITRVARTAREDVHAFDELPELIPGAEIIVILAPLTDETRHLVDAKFLGRMNDGALLVNLARGGLIDTDALVAEASTGRIRVALDVTDPEPLPEGHPLWSAPGVLITPHVAGGTTAMRPRMNNLLFKQLRRFADGDQLLNVVQH